MFKNNFLQLHSLSEFHSGSWNGILKGRNKAVAAAALFLLRVNPADLHHEREWTKI